MSSKERKKVKELYINNIREEVRDREDLNI